MSSKKPVMFATISLHKMAGGLERNILRIANYLAARGSDVSLLSFDLPEAEAFYPIDKKIKWHKVGRTPPHEGISWSERHRLLQRMRQALPENGTIIAFQHGLLARLMVASFGCGNRFICSERNALAMYDHIRFRKWNLNFFLMFLVSKILVQFESYKKQYPFLMHSKIQAIPNAVVQGENIAKPDLPEAGRFSILAVGRLCNQKNFAVLIEAFGNVANEFPNWDLVIVGEGSFKKELHAQIKKLDLDSRIFMPGASQSVENWYIKSHIFAMPSKWEGFPNALAEALAHGLPSIGFAGCAGVADLVKSGENGLLAEGNGHVNALSRQLKKLMSSPDLRASMGKAAAQSVSAYTPEKIYPQWENLLQDF